MDWVCKLVRYGKRYVVRIPKSVVVEYRLLPGIPVRVTFLGVVDWGPKCNPSPPAIRTLKTPGTPRLEQDGCTWISAVLLHGGFRVRFPSEIVDRVALHEGSIVRLDMIAAVPDAIPGWDGQGSKSKS